MADFTITHRIEAPELTAAITHLAEAVQGAARVSVPAPATVPAETPAVPPQSAPEAPASPAPDPSKVYSFDDLANAGAQLLEAGKMTQLTEVLKAHGVQAVTQLRPEQYADVAASLRALGAAI